MNVLTVNLIASTLVFWAIARVYVLPNLDRFGAQAVLVPILFLHAFRHLGLMFLAPGAIYPGIPPAFAGPAAYGDLLAAALAALSIPAVLGKWRAAPLLLWVFNVEGSVDLVAAIVLATTHRAADYMGAAYWIPAFWVPALLVTHYIVFRVLVGPTLRRLLPG